MKHAAPAVKIAEHALCQKPSLTDHHLFHNPKKYQKNRKQLFFAETMFAMLQKHALLAEKTAVCAQHLLHSPFPTNHEKLLFVAMLFAPQMKAATPALQIADNVLCQSLSLTGHERFPKHRLPLRDLLA